MRILIVRTDRLGDVVLSTPVIQLVRQAFPKAHLAMLVRPQTAPIVQGHPYLDEVIAREKRPGPVGWWAGWQLARVLKARRFDVALILHPTVRNHLVAWLANIPRRIGYEAKWPWLLTDRLPDRRAEGSQHERDYALDVARYWLARGDSPLPIEETRTGTVPSPFVPIRLDDELNIDAWLKRQGVNGEPLLVIHPGASCPSKRWPEARFAEMADRLAQEGHIRPVILTGPEEQERERGQRVLRQMKTPGLEACGGLSLNEVAALLKRSRLLISNDSGPVHLAAAVGTPVIAIFGRNQSGLSPTRWRPLGPRDQVLHRDVGCEACLAHRCQLDFLCLKMVTVEEVVVAARSALADTQVASHA